MRPAVFLDRDDTIVRRKGGGPTADLGDPADVEPMPGAEAACRDLKRAGWVLVVCTNQGGVARGNYTLADVNLVHQRVNDLLGGTIDAFRACPYHPLGTVPEYAREHPWRKPAPGMLFDAAAALSIDLARSWMVGDAPRDIAAGRAARCRTILLGPGDTPCEPAPDLRAPDIAGAAEIILRAHTERHS